MNTRKVKVPKREPYRIHDHDVCAPDALLISASPRNEKVLAAWFERVVFYVDAMQSLGRTVLIQNMDGELIVSSHRREVSDAK